MHARSFVFACLSILTAACSGSDGGNDPFGSGSASDSNGSASDSGITSSGSASAGTDSASGGSDTDTSGSASDSTTDSSTDSDSTGGTGGGPKFDVATGDAGVGGGCNDPDGECGCTSVDLLFVIDNSGSMGGYQEALGLAFPAFTDTLVTALPPGTNVHVGVTSTEMGYSSMGSTSISNGVCNFTGDGGQSEDGFYDTPDMGNSGKNGAQGRLYQANGDYYAEFNTDDPQNVIDGVKTWFNAAANIGTGGSNIEMLTAPAGWVAHTANDASNAGFIRDAGSVMVVFFMQDEPDQTPMMVNGQPTGTEMLNMLAGAKQQCGGVNCIIAGGFLEDNACGGRPIDDFLDGLPDPAQVTNLPPDNNAQQAADMMNAHLSNTLAGVIAQKCDEIPPVG